MIRRPPRSTQSRSSAASDVYKRQGLADGVGGRRDVDRQVACEGGLGGTQVDPVLRPRGTRDRRDYRAEVQLEVLGEHRLDVPASARVVPQTLLPRVGLDQRDLG